MDANISKEFIEQYFSRGSKKLPLILNQFEAEQFISNNRRIISTNDFPYRLPDFRASHTVSGFFFGLLIEKCINPDIPLSITAPDYFPFSYIWFLTYLYHDYAYSIVERTDSPIPVPQHIHRPNLNSVASRLEQCALFTTMHHLRISALPFSALWYRNPNTHSVTLKNALFRELTRSSSSRIGNTSPIRYNNGTTINKSRYDTTTIIRYFNYRIASNNVIDHGIVGGCLFYDRMIKNYIHAYISELQNAPPQDLGDFYHNNLHFSKEQLPFFSHIADCILSHNIWRKSDEKKIKYSDFLLDEILGDGYKIISYNDNPLLFILSVADSIEPTKIYKNIDAQMVARSIDITFDSNRHTITFSSRNPRIDIQKMYERANDLEYWTSVTVSPLNDGAFTLSL